MKDMKDVLKTFLAFIVGVGVSVFVVITIFALADRYINWLNHWLGQ